MQNIPKKNPQKATEKIYKIDKRHDQTFAKENKWMSNKHVQRQLMTLIPRKCKTIQPKSIYVYENG